MGLEEAFELQCPLNGGKGTGIIVYHSYTGYHGIDFTMCMLVNVYDTLLKAPLCAANVPMLLSLSAALLIVTLDGASLFANHRLLVIDMPCLFGLAAQLLGGGILLPAY